MIRQMRNQPGRTIEVVAGLICKDGRLLICQRDSKAAFPLKWEFPGGKVEKAELFEDALRRELQEELRIQIDEAEKIWQCEHRYETGFQVKLSFFRIRKYRGDVNNMVFHQIVWANFAELLQFDFLEGDLALVRELAVIGEPGFLAMPPLQG